VKKSDRDYIKIKPKKGFSIRPVLIHRGELEQGISEADYSSSQVPILLSTAFL